MQENRGQIRRKAVRKWFQKAADLGDSTAQLFMGKLYSNGYGVEEDAVEAFKWYLRSAEQDNCDAQHSVALCYGAGMGVERSMELSYEWFKKAIDNGYTLSEEEQKIVEEHNFSFDE